MNCPSFFISEYGLFDSKVKFPHASQTKDRPVTEYELEFFPTDYVGKSWINDVEHPMHHGCFLCAKPGQRRHSTLHYRCYYVHLSTEDQELDALLRQIPDGGFLPHPEEVTRIFQELLLLDPQQDPTAKLALQSGVCRLIRLLIHRSQSMPQADTHIAFILQAEHYIQTHLTEPLSLEQVAGAVNLSPFHFHRLFKDFFGLTPAQYILNCRIANAKLALLNETCSLAAVAANCGFSSQAYFCYKFKLVTGKTPLQYRREMLSKLDF